jgi:hypothetical protein
MPTKRYFRVRPEEVKTVALDSETWLLIRSFAKERNLTMAESISLLIQPALAACEGLDYMIPLRLNGFLQTRTNGVLPNKRARDFEA